MVWNFLALTNLFGWWAWHETAWNGMNTWHNHAQHCMTKDNRFDLFALIILHSIFTYVYINEKNLELIEMSLKEPKKIIVCKSVIIEGEIWDWKHKSWWRINLFSCRSPISCHIDWWIKRTQRPGLIYKVRPF